MIFDDSASQLPVVTKAANSFPFISDQRLPDGGWRRRSLATELLHLPLGIHQRRWPEEARRGCASRSRCQRRKTSRSHAQRRRRFLATERRRSSSVHSATTANTTYEHANSTAATTSPTAFDPRLLSERRTDGRLYRRRGRGAYATVFWTARW